MKVVACLSCLLVCLQSLNAQDAKMNNAVFAPSKYCGISLTPAVLAKAIIYGDKEEYQIKSAPQLGAELLINYHYHFEKNYVLILSQG